jgi:hypothetical protein
LWRWRVEWWEEGLKGGNDGWRGRNEWRGKPRKGREELGGGNNRVCFEGCVCRLVEVEVEVEVNLRLRGEMQQTDREQTERQMKSGGLKKRQD